MGQTMIWAILALIVLFGVIAVYLAFTQKKKHKTDYYALFVIGIIWVVIGLPIKQDILGVIGFIFMAVALYHKDEWKKNHMNLKKMSPKQRKIILGLLILGMLLLVIGIVAFFLKSRSCGY